jgi:hypothetical protein
MIMTNSLRDRADQCRKLARDYHPDVARPLIEKAQELEREAARRERGDVERRREAAPWPTPRSVRRVFGRAPARRPVIEAQPGILFPLWEPPRI